MLSFNKPIHLLPRQFLLNLFWGELKSMGRHPTDHIVPPLVKALALALALRAKALALALALRVKALALALALRVKALALALALRDGGLATTLASGLALGMRM